MTEMDGVRRIITLFGNFMKRDETGGQMGKGMWNLASRK